MSRRRKEFKVKDVDWRVWHGKMGKSDWKIPECVAETREVNRKEEGNATNASEFLDDPEVLDEKMKIVAELLRKAKCCVVYTGAGISRAAGIPDYGTKAENSVMNQYQQLKDPIFALPTYSHYALANLEREGLVDYYVQQNHDGLPQKAGFPQEKMNEIHGAIFDPSNPIIQFHESLRDDLFSALREIEKRIDFCLCMGTSLSGMTSDRCVKTPCKKYSKGVENCMGGVIMNLQFTPLDRPGYVPIRVWAKIDDAMALLMKHLGLEMKRLPMTTVEGDRIVCPYNEKGQYDKSKKMVLDLSPGKKVVICQPGASNEGDMGVVLKKDQTGHYLIAWTLSKRYLRHLGTWWLESIQKGKLMQLPLVNVDPEFIDE